MCKLLKEKMALISRGLSSLFLQLFLLEDFLAS